MTVFEHVAGNYYPVNSRILLQDESTKSQFTILTDSSQGGSSLSDGSLELNVHRRLVQGVGGDPLSEPGYNGKGLIVRGKQLLLLSSIEEAASLHRPLAQEMLLEPLVLFRGGGVSANVSPNVSLTNPLPANVHLLTLQTPDFSKSEDTSSCSLGATTLKFGDDKELSLPVTVQLD